MKAALALLIGLLVGALGVALWTSRATRDGASATTNHAAASVTEADCATSCDGGECVLGRCLRSGQCTRDTDCDDGNECSVEWCEAGVCRGGETASSCSGAGFDAGTCFSGFCERPTGDACTSDDACGAPVSACLARACVDGRCAVGAREDGLECATASGRPGTCEQGACVAGVDHRLRFSLEPEVLARTERDLEARLANNLRYDLRARLVPLAYGGFNIVLSNRRSRAEVRGLCDPSFIAFDLADYTASTNWKSANLQVWLEPDRGGWSVPTRGSRFAVDQGRANSLLGALGVVDVRTLRIWLERSFVPLDGRPPPPRTLVVASRVVERLLLPEDAGVLELRADAGPPAPVTPSGAQLLNRAWDAYGDGRMGEARRLAAQARALGKRDRELEQLLAESP